MRSARSLLLLLALLAPHAAHAGYTHYWKWLEPPPKDALEKCIAEMAKVVASERGNLAGSNGKGQPTIEKYVIEFNGVGEMAHEPFSFPEKIGFNFCKTQWKPYDRVVTACLLIARDYFSQDVLQISSDGEWAAWDSGARLYAEITGRAAKPPFSDARVMFNDPRLKPQVDPAQPPAQKPQSDCDDDEDRPRPPTPKKDDDSLWLLVPLVAGIAIVFYFWRRHAL